jgi:hypothetical protein
LPSECNPLRNLTFLIRILCDVKQRFLNQQLGKRASFKAAQQKAKLRSAAARLGASKKPGSLAPRPDEPGPRGAS